MLMLRALDFPTNTSTGLAYPPIFSNNQPVIFGDLRLKPRGTYGEPLFTHVNFDVLDTNSQQIATGVLFEGPTTALACKALARHHAKYAKLFDPLKYERWDTGIGEFCFRRNWRGQTLPPRTFVNTNVISFVRSGHAISLNGVNCHDVLATARIVDAALCAMSNGVPYEFPAPLKWGEPSGGFALSICLDKTNVPAGQPLLMARRIKNISDTNLPLAVTGYRDYSFVVKDASSNDVPKLELLKRREDPRGMVDVQCKEINMKPNQEREDKKTDLCELFDLSRAGTYSVQVRRRTGHAVVLSNIEFFDIVPSQPPNK